MSSEAGSVFPLSRLSVFDFSPLSPTNKAANTTAADTAFFYPRRCEWPRFTRGPLIQTLPSIGGFCQAPPPPPQPPMLPRTETLIHTRSFSCFT